MAPPVPDKCDACAAPVPTLNRQICSRCKAFAYCNAKCQAAHYGTHKVGCSALPQGELMPAEVEWDNARAAEVEKACKLLTPLVAKCMAADGETLDDVAIRGNLLVHAAVGGRLPEIDNLKGGFGFAAYRLPPAFATPPIPGQPGPGLRRTLCHLTRLFFLHTCSTIPDPLIRAVLRPFQPTEGLAEGFALVHSGEPAGRLYAPKALAVPDRLSAGEYEAIGDRMGIGLVTLGGEEYNGAGLKWSMLASVVSLVQVLAGTGVAV